MATSLRIPEASAPTGRLPRQWTRQYAVRLAQQNIVWPLVLIGAIPSSLEAHSFTQWWWAAAISVLVGMLYLLFGIPARYMLLSGWRPLFAVGVAVVVGGGLLRASDLHGSAGFGDAVPPVLFAGLMALRVRDHRRAVREVSGILRWPLGRGRWTVAEGTGTVLNHHWPAPAQRGALDLVGTVRGGRSTAALRPEACADFPAYGTEVLAPCDGVVRAAGDGYPDRPQRGAPAWGNHVVIAPDGGEEVMLAHLRQGSVAVRAGDRVARGQAVGQVGNSGNSSEPHLHIHAVRDGRPLRLRFAGVESSLRRGAVVSASATPSARE